MTAKQQELARNLLERAGVSVETISELRDGHDLIIALEVADELTDGESPPDENWYLDKFTITGEHMVLTEEGWLPAEMNQGDDPMEVLQEVNAPSRQPLRR